MNKKMVAFQIGLVLLSGVVAWIVEGLRGEPTVIVVEKNATSSVETKALSTPPNPPQNTAQKPSSPKIRHDYKLGETTDICGMVAEAKPFSRGVYLSLGNKFPKQTITVNVWNEKQLNEYVGKTICVFGTVKSFKDYLTVNINDKNDIRVY